MLCVCVVQVYAYVSLHMSASVRLSGCSTFAIKLVFSGSGPADICKVIAFIAFMTSFAPRRAFSSVMRRFPASWAKVCVAVSRYGVSIAQWCPLSGAHRWTLATMVAAVTWTVLSLTIIVASVVAVITGCSLAGISAVLPSMR